ncbi:MAG: pyridoxamine kinase [Clostridia bacterium]
MKKILTIQDISCIGQCSLTVALPIISACGVECCIMPTAVLSTHTYKFNNYTFLDLTNEMSKIAKHWQEQNFSFDSIYTGYIGSVEQIGIIDKMFADFGKDAKIVIDPVMADGGVLYTGFTPAFVKEMAKLIKKADIIVPNLTEASFLLDIPYVEKGYDRRYIENLCRSFTKLTNADVVLTGVSFEEDKLGVCVYNHAKDCVYYYFQNKIDIAMHGTGDVYASCLVGSLMRGKSLNESASIAVDYTVECIKQTIPDKSHWYGVEFEKAMPYLVERLNK